MNAYTKLLQRMFDTFSGIPDPELAPGIARIYIDLHQAYALSRLADAMENRTVDNDSWLAVATKLAQILEKVRIMDHHVAILYQHLSALQEQARQDDPVLRDVLAEEDEETRKEAMNDMADAMKTPLADKAWNF